jgi:hypothetical protein
MTRERFPYHRCGAIGENRRIFGWREVETAADFIKGNVVRTGLSGVFGWGQDAMPLATCVAAELEIDLLLQPTEGMLFLHPNLRDPMAFDSWRLYYREAKFVAWVDATEDQEPDWLPVFRIPPCCLPVFPWSKG